MMILRQRLFGAGFAAGCSLLAMHTAYALNGPTSIQIDGGPLGPLQLSGGMDGYFYAQSGTGTESAVGNNVTGANLSTALIEMQKTTGLMQFTIEVGPYGGALILGAKPTKASLNIFRASPLYAGYVTLAPTNSPVTISVGQIPSLEGYETVDWYNSNIFASDIFAVENLQSVGVSANYTKGPVSLTIDYGDGWDTRVFNFVQALGTYNFNSNNSINIYYAGNVSRTGLNALTYFGTSVAGYGAQYINSQMFGGWYSYTQGNLTIVPEVQYVYAKPDQLVGINKFTSNFGAAVFSDYTFGTSPYSLGAMAEYFDSNGKSNWFIAPEAKGYGIEATPTWQYKDLFLRGSVGFLHLTNGSAYGAADNGKDVVQSALEAGFLF
jgi:hypothetical protein